MITKEKLNVYKYFNGDIDGLARVGTAEQKALIGNKEWFTIDSLIQDIEMVNRGLAGQALMSVINERLLECCDSEETIQELKQIAHDT